MGTLIGPFGDEAVAALISAFVTTLVALFLYYRGKGKPQYLVCEEVLRTSVVEVKEEMEERRVRISYGGQEVQNLSLLKLKLYNSGSETIKDANIGISLNEEVKILDPRFETVPKLSASEDWIILPHDERELTNQKAFRIKYLKPFKPYKQWIGIDFICDGEIREVDIFGDGEGWTVKPLLGIAKERRRRWIRLGLLGAGFLTLLVFVIIFLDKRSEFIQLIFIMGILTAAFAELEFWVGARLERS
jgi:hypothetical protein